MKILLLGEFSGFHSNLRRGLQALGYRADLFGRRDGFKKIDVDLDLDFKGKSISSFLGTLKARLSIGRRAEGYDVVQLVNSILFMDMPVFNEIIMADLLRRSDNVFLSACGTDPLYMQKARSLMRYTPIESWLKEDKRSSRHPLEWTYYRKWHSYVCRNVEGIIPVGFDYSICYKNQQNIRRTIPLPIMIDDFAYNAIRVAGRIVVLHGLIRPGSKGTKHITSAFDLLDRKYPGKFEFISVGSLPLQEYLRVMERAHILVDQANSYSYGMNAVQALAMGKVVLSGMEPEALQDLGLQSSPVVNILPNAEQIADAIENIAEADALRARGEWSRRYAEEVHDARKVAARYLVEWTRS
nr:hypothetical protein RKHAN_00232 [Rhizobium sp. Khangiran2]